MKSKKDTEKVDNEHYDEAMVLNDSDDNLAESKDNKPTFKDKYSSKYFKSLYTLTYIFKYIVRRKCG